MVAIEEFFRGLWAILTAPDNATTEVGLLFALTALLISFWRQQKVYEKLCDEKDRRIDDVVSQRNKFQEIVLKEKGIDRETTQDTNHGS